MYKFCYCLTKPFITRIIVSLMFKNVIIRIEVTVFRDFRTLVKYPTESWERWVPPLGIGEVHTSPKKPPTFPYNFSKIWPWLYVNSVCVCMPLDFLSLLQMVIVAMHVSLVLENVIIRIEIIVFRDFMTLVK